MGNKKILALMYYFPPMGSVCSNRTTKILEGMSEKGYEISVIQAKFNTIPFDSDYSDQYLKYRKKIVNLDYRLIKKYMGFNAQESFFSDEKGSTIKSFFFKFLESKIGAWSIGEGGFFYIIRSYLAASKLIKKEGINYLLTSYRPLSDMIVASLLKLRFPQIIWIADMRDYYIRYDTENYFSKKQRIKQFRNLLNKTDLVLTVSEGIAQKIRKDILSKVQVLPNGYYPNSHLGIGYSKFKLSYTGSIYSFYDLALLFESIKEWINKNQLSPQEVEIEYAGRDSTVWQNYTDKYGLNQYSTIHSVVTLSEARKIQSESSINLLLSYSTKEYNGVVTGKLYDLLGAQKPILCIINGQLDPDLNQYFQELECGQIFYTDRMDRSSIVLYLKSQYNTWLGNDKNSTLLANSDVLEHYSWDKRINDLYQWISKI